VKSLESIYLKTLVEVIRTGSLSRAAETLHVTQPAVSKRIKFMETQYGCPLLDRSGNQIRATEAGRLVFEKARTLLEIESDLVASLHLLGGKSEIAFTSTPAFAAAHLPAILRNFLLNCSDMAELKVMSSTPAQMQQGLVEGMFDAAVVEGCEAFDLSGFVVKPLPDVEVTFIAAPAAGVPKTIASVEVLFGIPLFTRRPGCCSRTLLENALGALGYSLRDFRRVIVLDDLPILMNAVLAGEGLSFLPVDLLSDEVTADRVRSYAVPGFGHGRSRALVVAQPYRDRTPVALLAEAVLGHFAAREASAATRSSQAAPSCVRSTATPSRAGRARAPGGTRRRVTG